MNRNKIKNNLLLTFAAQAIAIAISFILNIIVPKYISEYQYAYWQTFILYQSYVGILHFGLVDGLVLRYSQYDYELLDKKEVRSQFYIMMLINVFSALVLMIIAAFSMQGVEKMLMIFVALGIVTKNLFTYNSYTFQITNRIDKYAYLTITQRLIYGGLVIILLILKVDNYFYFCLADLLSDISGIIFGVLFNRELCFGKSLLLKKAIKEACLSISIGWKLLVANWSSMFLVGSAKMVVQWRWSELVFGKISFAFSLTSLFLTFVNAISVVLFPMIKRMEEKDLPRMYQQIRNILSPTLIIMLVAYFPGSWILMNWLPKYAQSLSFLGILLPSVVYTSKVNLLTSNYLKAYRKEKEILIINLFSVFIGIALFASCAYLLNDIHLLSVGVVLAIIIKSIISEKIVTNIINISVTRDIIIEILMTIVFIISTNINNSVVGFGIYASAVVIYIVINRENVVTMVNCIMRK